MNAEIGRPGSEARDPPPLDDPDWPADSSVCGADDDFPCDGPDDDAGPTAAACGTAPGLAPGVPESQLSEWITAGVDHDERALAALYDATFSRVYGLVQRIVRNAATAEEVVEDTYFQVWRQAVRFDPARGKALTWLLSMARSRAIDALRREHRHSHETLLDDTVPETADDAPAADELLDLARHHADLHQALLQLGAQPRQLVSLAFFRGLTHEEIAEQTRLPLGTVKSQIRRALQSLRQALGSEGPLAFAS
ncbi:MAG TPA: sigma-70 family RNA polymerase sigma factor [Rubrivivax sp.]|nr:sigma-70 family RNA polymerase sigma factor [Rubrivivax sp.]